MKRAFEAARLDAALYLKTGRAALPLLGLIVYLLAFYSVGPVNAVASGAMAALALFLAAAWGAFGFVRSEDPVAVQLIEIKIDSPVRVAADHALTLLGLGLAPAVLAFIWPLAKYFVSGGAFFTPGLGAGETAAMFALEASYAVLGAAYGLLFSPRVIRDPRAAALGAVAGCLPAVFSGVIAARLPVFRFIAWVFPPVYPLIADFNETLVFASAPLGCAVLRCWLYTAAAFGLREILLRRRLH